MFQKARKLAVLQSYDVYTGVYVHRDPLRHIARTSHCAHGKCPQCAPEGACDILSLLPFVITPLIGALVLFWMIDSRGVLGSSIQWIFSDPNLSLKASTGLMWFL